MQLIQFCLFFVIGLATAAPSVYRRDNGLTTTVKIVNNCAKTIQLSTLSTTSAFSDPMPMVPGSSKTFTYEGMWSGRYWAREDCQGSGCQIAGAAYPASLAEFTFHGADGKDFYDLSFVDGYNLPLSITPVHPNTTSTNPLESGKYWCGAPACKAVPSCPSELQMTENDTYIGCLSACSKFGTSEYCCTGAHATAATCPINKYASAVKHGCPDAYSFAYDDDTSLYQCRAPSYTVTWCPN
ncbi:thaumatin [Gilbertella persicaria]|uniref:thaumatin n=1 Tax=Gilbertella persicaria TaxID=101096 RepID=UPI00221E794E|nr:thaumatin [Gilbertella persicaria]KAI8082622.1 thaumatin [Gilbertella persicaria]